MAAEKTKTAVVAAVIALLAIGGGFVAINTLTDSPPAERPRQPIAEPRIDAVTQPETILRFQNGAIVHILGITDRPNERDGWWAPDGSEIEAPESLPGRPISISVQRGTRIIQINASGGDGPMTLSLRPPAHGSGMASIPGRGGHRIYTYVAGIAGDLDTADLIVRTARGPWEVSLAREITPGEPPPRGHLGPAVIEDIREEDGETVVRIRNLPRPPGEQPMNEHYLLRTENGDLYAASASGRNGVTEYRFEVPLAMVKEIRYHARAFETIELRNISLRPGMQSEPVIAPVTARTGS